MCAVYMLSIYANTDRTVSVSAPTTPVSIETGPYYSLPDKNGGFANPGVGI